MKAVGSDDGEHAGKAPWVKISTSFIRGLKCKRCGASMRIKMPKT